MEAAMERAAAEAVTAVVEMAATVGRAVTEEAVGVVEVESGGGQRRRRKQQQWKRWKQHRWRRWKRRWKVADRSGSGRRRRKQKWPAEKLRRQQAYSAGGNTADDTKGCSGSWRLASRTPFHYAHAPHRLSHARRPPWRSPHAGCAPERLPPAGSTPAGPPCQRAGRFCRRAGRPSPPARRTAADGCGRLRAAADFAGWRRRARQHARSAVNHAGKPADACATWHRKPRKKRGERVPG